MRTQQRCRCGKLVCIIEGNDVQIKCNRCKRVVVVHTAGVRGVSFREEASGMYSNIRAEQ